MALALRPLTIGSPIYVHLADYEVMEDGHSIGRIMQERAEEPRDPERALVMVADDRQGAPRRHQDVGLRRGSRELQDVACNGTVYRRAAVPTVSSETGAGARAAGTAA
jgi:hypothetical protein